MQELQRSKSKYHKTEQLSFASLSVSSTPFFYADPHPLFPTRVTCPVFLVVSSPESGQSNTRVRSDIKSGVRSDMHTGAQRFVGRVS